MTTYLEMRSASISRDQWSQISDQRLKVREQKEPDWIFNRDMYFAVGEKWKWIDKRPWTDAQWRNYASDPNLRTFAAHYDAKLAGYYELRREAEPNEDGVAVEIAYFGLLPDFIGGGVGSALLTSAIENAWVWSPTPARVWVHTCNRDHPQALNNYQARGFRIYKVECESVIS